MFEPDIDVSTGFNDVKHESDKTNLDVFYDDIRKVIGFSEKGPLHPPIFNATFETFVNS